MKTLVAIAAGTILAAAGSASATLFQYATDSLSGNDAGGALHSLVTSYDSSSHQFTWSVTFSNQITEGFTLAVSPGPNPKNNPGQLAMLYFDASTPGDVAVSAYGYNGQNSLTSFIDGDGSTPHIEDPDFIAGTEAAGADHFGGVTEASVTDSLGMRTMTLTMDASVIQDHTPMYPDGTDPWTGVSFGEHIGFWFHTFTDLQTTYNDAGRLISWTYDGHGWSDQANLETVIVPLPPAVWAGLAGLLGAGIMRRRMG